MSKQSGFTLIEMLVVVGIFAVVASVLLFHYSDFSTNIALRNLADEIGLSVRKAQTYATSVRSITGTSGLTSDVFPAYGITFSTASTARHTYDPTYTSFTLFVDAAPYGDTHTNNLYENNDGICGNPKVGDECVESFGITSGDKIIGLETDKGSATTVNVVFHRPNPDAVICIPDASSPCANIASDLKITVQSPKGATRVVTIWNTGQIGVN